QRLPVNPLGAFEAATPEQTSTQMGACLCNGRMSVAKNRRPQSQGFAIELRGFVEAIFLIEEDGQVAQAVRSAQVIAPEAVIEEGESVAIELLGLRHPGGISGEEVGELEVTQGKGRDVGPEQPSPQIDGAAQV